jgi:sugar lactone lactonase YvrE
MAKTRRLPLIRHLTADSRSSIVFLVDHRSSIIDRRSPLPREILTTGPVQGGEVQTLADEQSLPVGLAIDEDAVYWANGFNGSVMRRLR